MVWEPLGGRGGIPSDMVTSDIEYQRRVKVSSEDAFSTAAENGRGYAGVITVEILSGQEVSVKTIHNANTCIRLIEGKGLDICYIIGDKSGTLMQLGSGRSLNRLSDDSYQYSIELYDGTPVGDRLVSRADEMNVPYFINGGAIIGLRNTMETSTFSVSFLFESLGGPILPFMLDGELQIEAGTEMSDYNGTN